MIHEDATHASRSDCKEVLAAFKAPIQFVNQAEVCFMDNGCALEGMVAPFAREMA